MDALEHPDKDSSEGGSTKAAPRTLKKPMFQVSVRSEETVLPCMVGP
jgi:hypothetical protein